LNKRRIFAGGCCSNDDGIRYGGGQAMWIFARKLSVSEGNKKLTDMVMLT